MLVFYNYDQNCTVHYHCCPITFAPRASKATLECVGITSWVGEELGCRELRVGDARILQVVYDQTHSKLAALLDQGVLTVSGLWPNPIESRPQSKLTVPRASDGTTNSCSTASSCWKKNGMQCSSGARPVAEGFYESTCKPAPSEHGSCRVVTSSARHILAADCWRGAGRRIGLKCVWLSLSWYLRM